MLSYDAHQKGDRCFKLRRETSKTHENIARNPRRDADGGVSVAQEKNNASRANKIITGVFYMHICKEWAGQKDSRPSSIVLPTSSSSTGGTQASVGIPPGSHKYVVTCLACE